MVQPFPPGFRTEDIETGGATIHVRVGGEGPAIVMLHGFADTGDGIGAWDEIVRSPLLWHFNFRGPDVERLVAGRERIYLDRFWNELSADPKLIDEATRQHYAELYARPSAMHSAFEQFAAFHQDAIDNMVFAAKGKLDMKVLAIGAKKSFGTAMADDLRFVASDVTGAVIANSGHWLMEEQPAATVAQIRAFLDR
jgi:pimeloyl-ACP methyl ester carboxylesterase